MAIEYVMPKLAMAMNEGTINEWLVQHGEMVEKAQPLAAIETEKTAYDVESPEEGFLCILLPEGETVPCNQLIAYFCETPEEVEQLATAAAAAEPEPPAEDAPAVADVPVSTTAAPSSNAVSSQAAPALARTSGERIVASPLAKKIALDNSFDLSLISGTGPNGRIIKLDVVEAIERGVSAPATAGAASRELARIPLKGVRKTIASRMLQSLQEAAQLTASWDSDITDLLEVRQKFVERTEQLGTRVSVNAFLIKAIVHAVKQVPIANACLENGEIIIYENINMGIAISMPGTTEYDSSLVVAVLHNVEHMGLVEIDLSMKALVNRLRNGEATPQDMSGSTITLSSTAGIGPEGLHSTPGS